MAGPRLRGRPPTLTLLPHVSALRERRLLALESRADIDLRTGRHREAVPGCGSSPGNIRCTSRSPCS
nr:hypothetical protein GCM10020093_001150 [Planobispora longispora]